MKNSYAENNAVNITIKNVSSGEIIDSKVYPKPTTNTIHYEYNVNSNYKITVEIDPDEDNYVSIVQDTSTHGNFYLSLGDLENNNPEEEDFNNIRVIVSLTNYNFNTPNTNSNTKAPIPLNVYLLIFAFLTYIVYRKSKNLT